jgi:hypothetical protein
MDFFAVAGTGAIVTTWWNGSVGWGPGWTQVVDGVAAPGSSVSAISRNPNHLDLFVVGSGNAVRSAYWDAATGWSSSWFLLSATGAPGSHVTAVNRSSDRIDLVSVDGPSLRAQAVKWDATNGWGGWSNNMGG